MLDITRLGCQIQKILPKIELNLVKNMKGYRFITDDDTARFCNRVTEALSNGWKLYGEPKMTFDKKRGIMRCGQAVIKNVPNKKYSKKINLSSI